MKKMADGGLPPAGVNIQDASRLTGLTIAQLRWRIRIPTDVGIPTGPAGDQDRSTAGK